MSPHRQQMYALHRILDAVHESGYDSARMTWHFDSEFYVNLHVAWGNDDILRNALLQINGVRKVDYCEVVVPHEVVIYVTLDPWKELK